VAALLGDDGKKGRAFKFDGQERRFRAEELLAPLGLDRSFLTRSTRGLLHELVFVRSARIRPVRVLPTAWRRRDHPRRAEPIRPAS
jgi:hypothetical protein